MGMYTEISARIELPEDSTPQSVLDILNYMLGEIEEYPELPDHALFKTARWEFMLRCCSYYHVPFSTFELKFDEIASDHFLVGRSDLKNYDNEIDLFFDWIAPYAESGMLGYSLYEEDDFPTVYVKDMNGKLLRSIPNMLQLNNT